MNKYPLGRDILVSWSLDLGGQPVNIAGCDFVFEYSTAGGAVRVPSTDYTIENNILSWTFRKEDQHAYGLYSLRLLAFDDGSLLAEFRDKAAFEIVHGTPSEEAQTLAMQSSVETTQESESEPEEETSDEVDNYVSRSPLYVEKVPLGSNLVVKWKLLSAADFDFPLDECELRLFYSAAGSGCQEAEDYELVSDNGYSIQWNFAGDKQVRFGMYSLFLDIYYQGARIATLVREDGFDLVHRKASDILTDRIIDFESVVTTFGGGALYMLTDILNDGYSTVYRSNGTTPAANGDVLRYNGEKWYAAQAGDLTASLENEIAALWLDSAGLHTRVADAEGNISTLTQTAAGFDLRVANVEGDVGDLQLTATALTARMTNAEGDIGLLELTATGLTTRITNAEGDIGSLELTATGLTTRISNAEGDISTLTQTATSLTSRIANAEGDISVLEQTATGLQYQVSNQAGDIATLQVSARGLTSRVSNAEGDISVLEQTATSLTSRISDAEGDISTLTQTANRIELAVQAVDSEVTRYEGVTDAALASMQDQIDGVIETWYYNGVPTLNNLPASQWTTVDEKNNHIGDLYYDKDTGKAYRFMLDSTENPAVYKWVELADEDIAKALALAGEKKRVFVVTPFAPYDVGDLWVRSRSVGSDTTSEIWRCKTSRAADASPGFLESEWESADNYGYVVNKSNLEVLSDAIVGQVGTYTYNADGTLTSSAASTIAQTATSIRLATVVDNVALAGITIDATNHTGSVTIFSDNFFIKDGSHTKTALAITHDSQGNSLIDVTSLNVAGIFTTTAWLGSGGVGGERNSVLSDAETNAETYANSSAYLNAYVLPMIQSETSGLAVDSDYSYLKTALANQTTALGGLLLTSLIQLGATESGGSWTVRAGISGVYDTTKLGNGIAAWYGGPMTDWKSLTEQQRLTTPFAKSLFRMDGSGYLASGEIQWGSAGDIILHGVGIESAVLDEQTKLTDGTTTFRVEDLILLRSWFSIDYYLDSSSQRHYYLKLNASGSDGTAIEGFVSNGFISAGGISGGGGQAGGNASLSNITSVSTGGYKGDISASGVGSLTVYDTAAVDAKVAGAANLQKVWDSLQNNDIVDTYDNYLIATPHIPDMASTYGYLKSADLSNIEAALSSLQCQVDSVAARDFADEISYAAGFIDTLSASTAYIGSIRLGSDPSTAYDVATKIASKQDTISDLSTIRSYSNEGHTAYGWGNHANAGYFLASNFTASNISTTLGSTYVTNATYATSAGNADTLDNYHASGLLTSLSSSSGSLSIGIGGATASSISISASTDSDGYNIASNMTTIGSALRSLQAQVDSVAARPYGPDEDLEMSISLLFNSVQAQIDSVSMKIQDFTANGFFDTLSVGAGIYAGSVLATGYITAGSASDMRLKDNIYPMNGEEAKRIVMALSPVTFTWNDKATSLCSEYKGDDWGFVAQQVQPIVPAAIGRFYDYLRLDYTKLITPLVSVAQDHERRLTEIERKLNS